MKTVVLGASSGLGRCLAVGLGQRGATVALMARRKDRLADAAKEAGPGATAIACDVTDQVSIQSAFDQAAETLGGIDALVYATGIGPLSRLADTDAATWRTLFDTNVIGASLVTAAALPHLAASNGVAAYLSSTSASLDPGISRPGRIRRKQGRAQQAGRGLAGRASRESDSPRSPWATVPADRATR